jgi:hypothetical protein
MYVRNKDGKMDRIDSGIALEACKICQNLSNEDKTVLKSLPVVLKQNGILPCANLLSRKHNELYEAIYKNGYEQFAWGKLIQLSDPERFMLERRLGILFIWLRRFSSE